MTQPEVDPNPPQSLAEIIQQRLANEESAAVQQQQQRRRYQHAMQNGFLVGLFVAILIAVIFMVESAI